MSTPNILEYVPLVSFINPSFWSKLTELKLDFDGLNETEHPIWGYFSNFRTGSSHVDSIMEVDSTSFNSEFGATNNYLPMRGKIFNRNTIEQFRECDKTMLINEQGARLWEKLKGPDGLEDPSVLNCFFILSFADLKKYHYYYWFAFPVPAHLTVIKNDIKPITDAFSELQLSSIYVKYKSFKSEQKTFFLIKKTTSDDVQVSTLNNLTNETADEISNNYFAFSDSYTSDVHPGWPLRNYIALLLYHCPDLEGKSVNFISIRLGRIKMEITCRNSLIFNVTLPHCNRNVEQAIFEQPNAWVGWEKNERGKYGPQMCNMKSSLDPISLAESAVDLNLKLMKWSLLPDIDLDKIKNAKCLLLGSGTLGCSVARSLLAWGVRNVKFVDRSRVSFSNPVRQNLFTYEDSVKNKPKAEAAAESLKRIFPSINSEGYSFDIPMPGHPVGELFLEKTRNNVEMLTQLVKESDVVFLLMDSRESRWLPTLLGNFFDKIVINAALGFDSYLVMRHGIQQKSEIEVEQPTRGLKVIRGEDLGCYFCSDVTAPGNSLGGRSLDQQCTVTRPGVSAIAGALAVELAVSLLQHSLGVSAPAFYTATQDSFDLPNDCVLGIVPHSIRGFLSTYSTVLPATERYKQCVACSDIVLEQYRLRGFEFLLEVFNSSKNLEELTGLKELHEKIDQEQVWELSDEEFSSTST